MAGALTVTCGACKKVMQVPEVLGGKRIRCRGCNATLTVAVPEPPPAAQVKSALKHGEIFEQATAYGIDKLDEQVRCAFCAADLDDGQVICLKCGYNMRTRERHNTRVLHIQSGGDYVLWHLPAVLCLIVSLCCVAGITIVWTGIPELEGFWGDTFQKWKWGAVYASVFLGFIFFGSTRFLIKRFIYNPHPPEVEIYAHEKDRGDDDD